MRLAMRALWRTPGWQMSIRCQPDGHMPYQLSAADELRTVITFTSAETRMRFAATPKETDSFHELCSSYG
jgi:hypothetical protein